MSEGAQWKFIDVADFVAAEILKFQQSRRRGRICLVIIAE